MKTSMNFLKKVMVVLLSVIMIVSTAGCAKNSSSGGNDSGASKDSTFSWWIGQGEEASYYSDYRNNPGVEYLLSKTWGPDEKKVDLEFSIPASGTQKENCNTLIATGEYTDLMEMSYYTGSAADLYEEGIAMDITEYVEKYMPNYMAYLDAHPDYKVTATNIVNGEPRFIQLYNYADVVDYNWGGYLYRRDWIIKYGTNSKDGSSFSGEYTVINEDGTPDPDSWVDNVVFPSGGSDPVYISDWEWMFDIFTKAIADLKITDGYCMSLYYPGYLGTGDLVCAFGGGGPSWYKQSADTIAFGGNSDNFRTYVQCMNTWYQNGWIDKAFPEHSTDMFYKIDETKVFSGKVGLWYATAATVGGRLADSTNPYLDGYVAFTARQPMNDIYGTAEQQNVEPYCMYQQSLESMTTIITDKAKDKDLVTLFTFLDELYSVEGGDLRTYGLSKKQYEESKNELYTKQGLTNGAYYEITSVDGKIKNEKDDIIKADGGTLASAVTAIRILGLDTFSKTSHEAETPTEKNNMQQWIYYTNTGFLTSSFTNQLSSEENKAYSKVQTSVDEFMSKSIPTFIKGEKDPYKDDDWNAYVKALSKYSPEKNTAIYQNLLDTLNKK